MCDRLWDDGQFLLHRQVIAVEENICNTALMIRAQENGKRIRWRKMRELCDMIHSERLQRLWDNEKGPTTSDFYKKASKEIGDQWDEIRECTEKLQSERAAWLMELTGCAHGWGKGDWYDSTH